MSANSHDPFVAANVKGFLDDFMLSEEYQTFDSEGETVERVFVVDYVLADADSVVVHIGIETDEACEADDADIQKLIGHAMSALKTECPEAARRAVRFVVKMANG